MNFNGSMPQSIHTSLRWYIISCLRPMVLRVCHLRSLSRSDYWLDYGSDLGSLLWSGNEVTFEPWNGGRFGPRSGGSFGPRFGGSFGQGPESVILAQIAFSLREILNENGVPWSRKGVILADFEKKMSFTCRIEHLDVRKGSFWGHFRAIQSHFGGVSKGGQNDPQMTPKSGPKTSSFLGPKETRKRARLCPRFGLIISIGKEAWPSLVR